MAAGPELSKLAERLVEVRGRLDGDVADEMLRAIFRLNNEIGRLSATRRDLRESLAELQAKVNLVTVLVKRARFPEARDSFREVENTFIRIDRPRQSQKEFIERRGPETN